MTLRTRIAASGLAAVAALAPLPSVSTLATGATVGIIGGTAVGMAAAQEAQAAQGIVRNTCAVNRLPLYTGNTLYALGSSLGCSSGRYANYVTAPGPFRLVNVNTGVASTYAANAVVNIQGKNFYGYRL